MEPPVLREISLAASSIVAAVTNQQYDGVMKNAILIIEMCEKESVASRKRSRTCMDENGILSQENKTDIEAGFQSTVETQELEEREKLSLVEESDKAGTFIIPFGKHKGTRLDKVPADYLCWLMGMKREKGKFSPASTDTLNWVRANQYDTLSHVKRYLTWRCWECGSHDVRFRTAHLCSHCWFQSRK
jgi:uncharacterized protein (DUF3820 family)